MEKSFALDSHEMTSIRVQLASQLAEQGDMDEADILFNQSLIQLRADSPAGDPRKAVTLADALLGLGRIAESRVDPQTASRYWSQALTVTQTVSEDTGLMEAVYTHALALLYLNRADEARPLIDRLQVVGRRSRHLSELCRLHGIDL